MPRRTIHSPARSALPRTDAARFRAAVVLLTGMGISLAACGYVAGVQSALDASPDTFRWSSALLLLGLGVGPRLPRWLARRVLPAGTGWQLREGGTSPLLDFAERGRQVAWVVVAVLAAAGGVVVLILPGLLSVGRSLYAAALREFLWTGWTLGVLDVLLMALVAPPFVVLGMLAQCVHRLGSDPRRWQAEASALLVCGAGLGLCVVSGLQLWTGGDALVLRAAPMPLLAAALLAVWRAGADPEPRRRRRQAPPLPAEPESGSQWLVVLRLALGIAAASATCAVLVWVYVVDALDMASGAWRPFSGGLLLLAGGVGLAFSTIGAARDGANWMGAFGVRLALAGGVLAAGMALFNLVTRASYPAFLHSPAVWLLWGVGAALPVAVLAWALGGGIRAFLSRSADDPGAGAVLLQILISASAGAFLVIVFPLLERLGSYPLLVATALALLATGGTLVIHDPSMSRRLQRFRLTAVFGGVVVMTFLMPEAGRHWLGHQQRLRPRMWESWWGTQDVPGPRRDWGAVALLDGDVLDWYRVRAGCRVGVISLFGDARLDLPASFSGRVDQWALLTRRTAPRATLDERPALQALRATRNRYDVLVLALADAAPEFVQGLLADGLLERAWAHLAPDAALICVTPSGDATEAALQAALSGPQAEGGRPASIRRLWRGERMCLAARVDRGAGGGDDPARWAAERGPAGAFLDHPDLAPAGRGAVAAGR